MKNLFISTTTFGQADNSVLNQLKISGINFELNPRGRKLKPEETAQLASGCDAIIAGVEDLTSLIDSSKKLKFICRLGVGLENVPIQLCKDKGIKLSFTPDAVTPAISELTVALTLGITRNICISDFSIRSGNWKRKSGFRIGGSTIGIIGFGRVGQKVAELFSVFNPKKLLINDVCYNEDKIKRLKKNGVDVHKCDIKDILVKSDIISLHTGLNKKTKNLINISKLKLMKKNAVIINTSRGEIINETDLYDALKSKMIAGAALDVFSNEPYDGRLMELDNIILSPHQGSATLDCRNKMESEAVEEVLRFFNNNPLKQEVLF